MWSTWVAWPHDAAQAPQLSILAGLALADVLDPWLAAGLKWPNDLLAPDRSKLAGILAEGVWRCDRLAGVVIGVGLNLRWTGTRPQGLAHAGTVADWSAAPLPRIDLIAAWRERLDSDLALPAEARGKRAAARFARRILPGARAVSLKTVDGPPTVGYIEGITEGGELLLRRADDGTVMTTGVGELAWADRPDQP